MDSSNLPPPAAIKPSLAIMRGCLIAPRQAFGDAFEVEGDGTLAACAIGAMYLGFGVDYLGLLLETEESGASWSYLLNEWEFEYRRATFEVWEAYFVHYGVRMSTDNDENGLTREEIALRLAKIGL